MRRDATDETRAAWTQLETWARPYRYRVKGDSEGFPIIPGRLGQIEWYEESHLAVFTTHLTVTPQLRRIPGMRPWHVGDREFRAVFPVQALPAVGQIVKARIHRVQKAPRMAYRPPPSLQDRS